MILCHCRVCWGLWSLLALCRFQQRGGCSWCGWQSHWVLLSLVLFLNPHQIWNPNWFTALRFVSIQCILLLPNKQASAYLIYFKFQLLITFPVAGRGAVMVLGLFAFLCAALRRPRCFWEWFALQMLQQLQVPSLLVLGRVGAAGAPPVSCKKPGPVSALGGAGN